MRILLVDNFLYRRGGAEVVFLNTGELLKAKGHHVIYFSQQWPDNISSSYEKYFPQGIDVNVSAVIGKIKGIGKYFYNREAAIKLEQLIKNEKPDVAHLHLFWGGITGSIFRVLKKYNIPIIHTVHDYRMICPAYSFKNSKNAICEKCAGKKFYHCIRNLCSKGKLSLSIFMSLEIYLRNLLFNPIDNIDSFMFVSDFSYNKHLQYEPRYSQKHCVTMYNFQDQMIVSQIERTMSTYDSYYLYYGRLSYEKGLSTLIKAFSDFPNITLKIVGTGPIEGDLKQLCKDINATNVEFLGFRTGNFLFDLIKKAKYVCVPSEWYENNPMTIIESYTLRTPVIGASIGGIPEIIDDNSTGFRFVPCDIDALKEALAKAESLSEIEYIRMKDNAERFANKIFDSDVYYERLMQLYLYTINNYRMK